MPQTSESPQILVWHSQAEAYREALAHRCRGAAVEALVPGTGEAEALLARAAGQERHVAGSGAVVLLAWQVPDGLLRALPSLRWIQVTGAGVDHFLDRDDLPDGVLVTRSLGRFGQQVAEYVVGYLLHHLLEIDGYRARQRRRLWERGERPLLADRTVGIIGLGSLGMPLARTLAAFGTRVVAMRRSGADSEAVERVYGPETWRQMLPACDALVLAAPHTPETDKMIDADALAALPQGAVLVNVARGGLIDEEALLAALGSGHLGAAVLDVFAREPLPEDHPLWRQELAWITPHIAAPSELGPMVDELVANYERFIAGEPLLNLVDRGRGY
jgi:glyoxylate/hydroxypyruvate reductase A